MNLQSLLERNQPHIFHTIVWIFLTIIGGAVALVSTKDQKNPP